MSANETSKASASGAAALFNEFLTRAVRRGNLSVENRRVRSRQPETEIFVRKALVAVRRVAASLIPSVKVAELPNPRGGAMNLAEATARSFSANPSLQHYLGEPFAVKTGGAQHSLTRAELFSALHALALLEVTNGLSAAPDFGVSAASVGIGLAGQSDRVAARIREAADSVFAQSFADAHAVTLMAAFEGNEAAITALKEVHRRRDAAGDFGSYSLAPLSQDTKSALEILRAQLERGKDFSTMSRHNLWTHSMWIASEGLSTWMQRHGVAPRSTAGVQNALETAGHIMDMASVRMSPYVRIAPRPNA